MRLAIFAVVVFSLLTLASASAEKAAAPAPSSAVTPPPRIAVFNMVAIMKEFNKAKFQVKELTEERKKMTGGVTEMKAEYVKLQQDVQTQQIPALKEKMQERLVVLGRRIEDKTRRIDKSLNEEASTIIAGLYDDIKSVVDGLAEKRGYDLVLAYPDAAGPEEMKSNYMKELKLKPPAAQPFFVAKRCDLTRDVIDELNKRFPPEPKAEKEKDDE